MIKLLFISSTKQSRLKLALIHSISKTFPASDLAHKLSTELSGQITLKAFLSPFFFFASAVPCYKLKPRGKDWRVHFILR